MNVLKTPIEGVVIIEPRLFADSRGYFFESFNQREFDEKVALPLTGGPIVFVQDNESRSSFGVVRGLHFQKPPHTQNKLVRCLEGRILDVAVDLRRGSPTYLRHVSVELTGENHLSLFVPAGFAHGFSVLSGQATVLYKCDRFYHPGSDSGIQLLDPSLGIDWGIDLDRAVMSDKDRTRPLLSETEIDFEY